jgi:hypothetical protein
MASHERTAQGQELTAEDHEPRAVNHEPTAVNHEPTAEDHEPTAAARASRIRGAGRFVPRHGPQERLVIDQGVPAQVRRPLRAAIVSLPARHSPSVRMGGDESTTRERGLAPAVRATTVREATQGRAGCRQPPGRTGRMSGRVDGRKVVRLMADHDRPVSGRADGQARMRGEGKTRARLRTDGKTRIQPALGR